MEKKYNQQPFRRSEIDRNRRTGWVVDLSVGGTVNPDCYWYFKTKKQGLQFIQLLNNGWSATASREIVHQL